jgi:electron transport complex protein RnfG
MHVLKPALTLFGVALATVAMLGLVYNLTREPIEANNQRVRLAAMQEVLPRAERFEPYEKAALSGNIAAVYQGFEGDSPAGFVLEMSPEGYSGPIHMLVGICAAQHAVSGMRVLRHTETPGLGSLAAGEKFTRLFDNRPLIPITVVKSGAGEHEIDALTSATVTTKAITEAVNEAILTVTRWAAYE